MRILHVTNAVDWSGGMEQIVLLINELLKKGHENILVCQPGSRLIPKLSHLAVEIFKIPMRQDYDLTAAYHLRNRIRSQSPDIVHAHHPIAHAVSLVALTGTRKPPFVVSRRVSFPPRKNPFSRWKYRSKRIGAYAVVSQSVKEILAAGGVDPSRISVVYSAANPKLFVSKIPAEEIRSAFQIPQGYSVVAKVANYSPWKGQHVFIAAARKCLGKTNRVVFLLVGKGTEQLVEEVECLGLSSAVRILGFRKDIPDILSILDVSVNAAIEGEGLSGAVRESLLMEIPVVASNVAGNGEIVKDGVTGYLVPPDNPDALAEKILETLENRSRAKAMAKRGHIWVMENAIPEKMAGSLINLYQSLIT